MLQQEAGGQRALWLLLSSAQIEYLQQGLARISQKPFCFGPRSIWHLVALLAASDTALALLEMRLTRLVEASPAVLFLSYVP